MSQAFGKLEFDSAQIHMDLLALPVGNLLAPLEKNAEVLAAEIDPAFSDTAAFCEHYGIALDEVANCIILEAHRGERIWYAACVIRADTRADVNSVARKALDARSASFANGERAAQFTGMEYGGITPIGLPEGWPILIDKAVADADFIIIGSGKRGSKIATSGEFLANLPNAQVLEGLGRPIE